MLAEFIDKIPHYLIDGIAIMAMAFVISKVMRWIIRRQLSKMDPESAESTGLRFLKNTLRFLIWVTASFAIIFSIPQLQAVASTMFAGAGLLVAIIGFAAQTALGNIISGFFIVIFKPFRVGDIITVGSEFRGKVTDITLRHTNIRDFRNRRIIIPNSLVSSQTIVNENIADSRICRWVEFRIPLDADLDLAIDVIRREAENHPLSLDQRSAEETAAKKPKVAVKVTQLGEYFAEVTAFVWAAGPSEAWDLNTELNLSTKKALHHAGIDLAVPLRKVIFNDQNFNEQFMVTVPPTHRPSHNP